ncbi:unnamed protein product, partial [marine sediment metagenome]
RPRRVERSQSSWYSGASMDAKSAVSFDDLWTPDQPLPGRAGLLGIAERCGRAWGLAELTGQVRIAYNPRLRTTLGRALLDARRVELNTRLLREHPEELVSLLAHELAHVVVHIRHGRVSPHGAPFRALMRRLGLSPRATHSLPTRHLRRRRRRYLYLHRCGNCSYTFLARRVRRDLHCRACGPDMAWTIVRAPNSLRGRKMLAAFGKGAS